MTNAQKNSATLNQIAESIDEIIWKLDLKTQKFTYISPSVEKVRGVKVEQALSGTLEESLPSDDYLMINTKIQEIFDKVKAGEEPPREFHFETKHYNKNNEIIWLKVKASLILDENNQPLEAIGISHDITEDKKKQIELEKNYQREKFYADIIRNSSQPIGIAYEDGTGKFLNDAGYDFLGYTPQEVEQLNWIYDITPPQWIAEEVKILKKAVETNSSVTYKKEYIHKSGKIIPVELRVYPKFDANGNFTHYIAFITDISEIEEAKKELNFSKERLEFALMGSNDGIWDWDLKTNYLYMSPRYLEIIGYNEDEIEYHIDFFLKLLPKDQIDIVKTHFNKYSISKDLRVESTIQLIHKKGHSIPVLSRAYKILDSNGQAKRIVGTHTDLTEINSLKTLLEENETKYKYLFDHSNIGIGISTLDGQLIEANQFLLHLLRIKKNETNTIKLRRFYKIAKVRDYFIEEINNKGEVNNFRFEMLQSNGKSIWVSLSSKKIKHQGKTRLINAITNIDNQIKAEQKLIESEERFKQISKLTTEGILIHKNGRVLDANDSLLKMLGYTLGEIQNTVFLDYCSSHNMSDQYIKKALESSYRNFELELIAKNGQLIPVEVNGRTTNYAGKKVQVTSFLDISSRLQTESTIQLLSTAVEQSVHSVIITNTKGIIEYVNPSFTLVTKFEKEEVTGQNVKILSSGYHSQEFYDQMWEQITNGNAWKGEFYNKDKNGHFFWARTTITPIKNKNGDITNFLSIMEDITQRKKEKEEIEKLSTRLKLAVQAANFGYWEYNIDTQEAFWDDNMYEFFNVENKEDINLFEFFTSFFNEQSFSKFKKSILYGLEQKNVVDIETNLQINGNDKVFKSFILANPISDKNEKSIVGITIDITQQNKFEAELIEKRKKAEESDQLKSAFLANMSHEIRTPLNSIIGFTSLMEEDFDIFSEEESSKYLHIISENGKHLLSLVNDIIDISKIESGQLLITNQSFILDNIIQKLEENYKNSLSDMVKLTFERNLNQLKLKTDSTRLTQILTNLIGNAIKFTQKGHIKISSKLVGRFLHFSIEDTGIGIKEEAKPIIFERFAQGQPIKDQLLGGTGLGLSITKGLVKLLGGTIWFESEEGKGSTFYFKILVDNS